jgi:hypothetical protein
MDVFSYSNVFKKFAFAVKSLLTYRSWDPYRPEEFLFLVGLPTQIEKKSPKKSRF